MTSKKQKIKREALDISKENSHISTQGKEAPRDLISEFIEKKKETIAEKPVETIKPKEEPKKVTEENKSLPELIKALKESMDSCDINFKLRLAAERYFDSIGESYINTSGDLVEPKKNDA